MSSFDGAVNDLTMADIERLFPHVPKFEISEKEYEKRQDTALQFLKNVKRTVEQGALKTKAESAADTLKVDDKVIVMPGSRIGTIRYIGPFHLDTTDDINDSGKVWYGIELDLPTGKNNGSFRGTTHSTDDDQDEQDFYYFSCPDNHGIFVKRQALTPLITYSEDFDDDADLML